MEGEKEMSEVMVSNSVPPGGDVGDVLTKTGVQNYAVGWRKPDVNNNEGGGVTTTVDLPSGIIVIWSGSTNNVPVGWALCDGTNGTPDLRDRFVLGSGTKHSVGEKGGAEEVTLTVAQMPGHSHGIADGDVPVMYYSDHGSVMTYEAPYPSLKNPTYNSTSVGENNPHNNMPPYYTLAYIMKK